MCKTIKSLPMMSTMVHNDFDNSDSNKNNDEQDNNADDVACTT